jgi:hypothetical protein
MYNSPEFADVEFQVGQKQFKAHKSVLVRRCPILLELVQNSGEAIVKVPNIHSAVFETILKYIYTVTQPEFLKIDPAEAVLIASDHYGVTDLKLLVESILADKYLEEDTAARLFILADSYNCPLLKEEAMKKYVSNPEEVMEHDPSWPMVEESAKFMAELLKFATVVSKKIPDDSCIGSLDVSTLRRRLEEVNLSLDGTRDMLVDRLKAYFEEDESDSD